MSSSIKIDAFCPVGIGGTKGIDTTHLKIFVGGLSPKHTSKDLYDMFIHYGAIRESVVIPDRFRVRSRCYGFVTFVNHAAVSDVFRQSPITTTDGTKLTVVLASANTKPRRAHFNVRHGTSGHKPLPCVKEDDEASNAMAQNIKVSKKENAANNNSDNKKVGIYSDPSLFRTANIQPIAPAQFFVNNKKKKVAEVEEHGWPNDDIRKDFHNLTRVKAANGHKTARKSWRLVSVQKEPEKHSYFAANDAQSDFADDDFYSVCSRKWTPLHKRNSGDSVSDYGDDNGNMGSTFMPSPSNASVSSSHNSQKQSNVPNPIQVNTANESEDDMAFLLMLNNSNLMRNMLDLPEGIEKLRVAFKQRMQNQIARKTYHNSSNGSQHSSFSNVDAVPFTSYCPNNGLWSPYAPSFPVCSMNSGNDSTQSKPSEVVTPLIDYNFGAAVVPTPPVHQMGAMTQFPMQAHVPLARSMSNDAASHGTGISYENVCNAFPAPMYFDSNSQLHHNQISQ